VIRQFAQDVARMVKRDERALAKLADTTTPKRDETARHLADVRGERRNLARAIAKVEDPSVMVAYDDELAAREKRLVAELGRVPNPVTPQRLAAARQGLLGAAEAIERAGRTGAVEGLRKLATETGLAVTVDGATADVRLGYEDPYARMVGRG